MIHKVDPDLWFDQNFVKLSPEQKFIVLALCLCDETTNDGVYEASQAAILDMARITGMSPDAWASVINGIASQEDGLVRTVSAISNPYIQIDLGKLGRYFPRFKKDAR